MSDLKSIVGGVKCIRKTDTYYGIEFVTGEEARLYILNNHVFRYYMSPKGIFLDYPEPLNPEDIVKFVSKDMDAYGLEAYNQSSLKDIDSHYIIQTEDIQILFDKIQGTIKACNIRRDKDIFCESNPLSYIDNKSTQTLHQRNDEYFYGGGTQNSKFNHKGRIIKIVDTGQSKYDITSPCPFYWSSNGYGILRNTWQPGIYDFGDKSQHYVVTEHTGEDFDAYIFINESPKDILKDYYELTGQPILLPEYAYYESHLNVFNRDYWVTVRPEIRLATLFEDGKYYKNLGPGEIGVKEGILESLNGEKNNYQFSARAMIDRYKKHDVPLGWFIPNEIDDTGYGQTDSLDGDIENLKQFVDYCLKHGVECGLWTVSKFAPVDPLNPKKGERDLAKEVEVAHIRVIKLDLTFLECDYSHGLTAVENASNIFTKCTTDSVRPFIIMSDGWAGTQRYAAIWSCDKNRGEWDYIREHIPTYIGASLSGLPAVGSGKDGSQTGGCKEVTIRDYQWKAFTPLQLNLDGLGNISNTPFSYDDEATRINRGYLKLKSMLMPYNYSIGYESIHGLPMIRAMFLEFPEETSAYTLDSQYQYMWGPNILVAPIYDEEKVGQNSIRNGIYLPDPKQVWIDFLTGEKYQGGKIYNHIATPLWKIPVFIKEGSILPMTNPNNNPHEIKRDHRTFTIYPNASCSFLVYEDDGISLQYLKGHYATTKIEASGPASNGNGDLVIKIYKTNGDYKNMVKKRHTLIQVMASKTVKHVKITINKKPMTLKRVNNADEFVKHENCFYFDKDFFINPYLKQYNETKQKFILIKLEELDVTTNEVIITVGDFSNKETNIKELKVDKSLKTPSNLRKMDLIRPYSDIFLEWKNRDNVDYYEIERDGDIFTNIKTNVFMFQNFYPNSGHEFRIRSVLGDKASEWSNKLNVDVYDEPNKYIVMGVTSNLICYPVTESDENALANFETSEGKVSIRQVNYDLGHVYNIDKIDYVLQNNNRKLIEIKYRYSVDNIVWSEFSEPTQTINEITIKTLSLNGIKLRYIEIVSSDRGSLMAVVFHRKP